MDRDSWWPPSDLFLTTLVIEEPSHLRLLWLLDFSPHALSVGCKRHSQGLSCCLSAALQERSGSGWPWTSYAGGYLTAEELSRFRKLTDASGYERSTFDWLNDKAFHLFLWKLLNLEIVCLWKIFCFCLHQRRSWTFRCSFVWVTWREREILNKERCFQKQSVTVLKWNNSAPNKFKHKTRINWYFKFIFLDFYNALL